MIHERANGHLDRDASPNRQAVSIRPLDEDSIARVLAEFPGARGRTARRVPDRPVARA